MQISLPNRRCLGALAAACLVSVALPQAAWAQKTKTKTLPAEQTAPASETSFKLDIPTIETVGSNVDEATLREVLNGDITGNAEALAGLTAEKITIPTISLRGSDDEDDHAFNLTYTDIVFDSVQNGVASSMSVGGADLAAGEEGSASFGMFSANNVNIAGILALYGLVETERTEVKSTIYSNLRFEGGTFTSPEIKCTIGKASVGEFKARPFGFSIPEFMAVMEQLEEEEDSPSPELIGRAMRMYADLFTAFESAPAEFGGFDCSGVDEEGGKIDFTIAGIRMDGFRSGIYPAISMDGFDIDVEGDGKVSLGNVTIKETDLSGPLAAVEAAPEAVDQAWFEQNARSLVPAFGGFSFSDVNVDVPNPDGGERIQAGIDAFDLSLMNYLNGIPTNISTHADHITFALPEDSDDEQTQKLIDLGLTNLDAGFALSAGWNEAEDTITLNELSVTGADLATVVLTGTIINATEALFDVNPEQSLLAAMGLAISRLKLDVTDEGLSDLIVAAVSAEQNATPEQMRPIFAGLAEGTVISFLAGAAEAQKVGSAISDFVAGKVSHLTLEMTAKEPSGIGLIEFSQAQENPAQLVNELTIDAKTN